MVEILERKAAHAGAQTFSYSGNAWARTFTYSAHAGAQTITYSAHVGARTFTYSANAWARTFSYSANAGAQTITYSAHAWARTFSYSANAWAILLDINSTRFIISTRFCSAHPGRVWSSSKRKEATVQSIHSTLTNLRTNASSLSGQFKRRRISEWDILPSLSGSQKYTSRLLFTIHPNPWHISTFSRRSAGGGVCERIAFDGCGLQDCQTRVQFELSFVEFFRRLIFPRLECLGKSICHVIKLLIWQIAIPFAFMIEHILGGLEIHFR